MKIAQQVCKGGANMKSSLKRIHDKLQNFEARKLQKPNKNKNLMRLSKPDTIKNDIVNLADKV